MEALVIDRVAFAAWVKDLDAREASYMREHPEKTIMPPAPPVYAQRWSQRQLPTKTVIATVEVRESESIRGMWWVWVNGHKYTSFLGDDAHLKASKLAGDLLKE